MVKTSPLWMVLWHTLRTPKEETFSKTRLLTRVVEVNRISRKNVNIYG